METNTIKPNLVLIAIVAALGGLLFGYDTGVINGTQFYFSKFFDLSPLQKGWIVGSALIGCFFGALVAGVLSKQIGRKYALIISSALFTVSAWGSGLPEFLPQSVELLVVFRIIGGLGIGIASMNAPMYIAELSPSSVRGKLVTIYQMAIVLGFFTVFLATYFIGSDQSEAYNTSTGWRWMFWSELIPCLMFLVFLFFIPKSPRWLYLNNRKDEAKQILENVQGAENVADTIQEIEQSVQEAASEIQIKDIFQKSIFGIILIGSVLSALQQFTGINAVLYYGADIFEKSLGFGPEDVLKQQVLLASVNVLFTILAMFTVDKWGRKPLLITGAFGMITGFLLLSITMITESVGILSLLGVLMFIGSFAMSMGPIVWVLLSEMYPNRMRSIGMSIAVAVQWAANYVVSQFFPVIVESETNNQGFWNGSLPYFIFIAFILIIVQFTRKYIPETKGKSLEEIEKLWE